MNCQETIESLWAYLDREAEPGLRRDLEAHLEGCEPCRRELEQSRRLGGVLEQYQVPAAPAGMAQRVIRAARPVSVLRRIPVWRAAAAAALLAVGVFAAYQALKPAAPSGEGPVAKDVEKVSPAPKEEIPAPRIPVPAKEEKEPVQVARVEENSKDEEAILEHLELLENWEALNDPDLALAFSLPEEEFTALVDALEGGM